MNPIIEPLSERAWNRVEKRILDQLEQLDRLERDGAGEAADVRRSPMLPRCELVRAVLSMPDRVRSWLELVTDFGRRRGSSDVEPASGVRWRAGSVTGVRIALPSR